MTMRDCDGFLYNYLEAATQHQYYYEYDPGKTMKYKIEIVVSSPIYMYIG